MNRLFLINLEIKNRLLFVINIVNLLEVQYSISINWLLILISIQRLQIHEIVKNSKFCYAPADHIITGNLKIISDSRIRSIISKGPKHRLPSQIDFNKCNEEIAAAFYEFCKRLCDVECNALNIWKISIFNIIEKCISFYSKNLNLLPPKPKLSFRHLKQGIQQFHEKFVFAPAGEASNNAIVV